MTRHNAVVVQPLKRTLLFTAITATAVARSLETCLTQIILHCSSPLLLLDPLA